MALEADFGTRPSDYCCPVTRASGGIGRRAGFRFLCPRGCGGSSPPSPTRLTSTFVIGVDQRRSVGTRMVTALTNVSRAAGMRTSSGLAEPEDAPEDAVRRDQQGVDMGRGG